MGGVWCGMAPAEPISVPVWLERLGGRVTDPLTGRTYDLLADYAEQSCRMDLSTGRISCEFVPREGAGCVMVTIFLPQKNIWVHVLAKEETMDVPAQANRKPEAVVPRKTCGVTLPPMTHAEAVRRRLEVNGWTMTSIWPDNRKSL